MLQHVRRADVQLRIWHGAFQSHPPGLGPNGHGWHRTADGKFSPVFMTVDPMPKAVTELIKCSCTSSKCSGRCSCSSANLPCTDACSCEGDTDCQNPLRQEALLDENLSSDDETESDPEI